MRGQGFGPVISQVGGHAVPHERYSFTPGHCEKSQALSSKYKHSSIRASVDALCRDGAGLISRERVQRGRLTRQGTTS